VAVVVAVVVAAAAGAGVEWALNHGTAGGQSGLFPIGPSGNSGPSGNTGSGTTPSGNSVSGIATEVDPAIVDIDTTLTQGGGAAGTGMVLTSSGLVLTNNHVIENASTIEAQVDGSGRQYGATVLGYSVSDDIALLQLKDASGLRTVVTGNSSDVAVGTSIVGIGNAGGAGGTPSATGGSVTAVNQTITASGDGLLPETLHGLIQIDADIQLGDSGGPLVDTAGHVIGMDTAASVNGNGFGEQSGTGGEGFAISIDNALSIVDQIKAGKASATVQIGPRALLGVAITDGRSPPGAYVDEVEPGSPADAAGIVQGDTIVSVGSTTVATGAALSNALVGHKPGDTVTVGWIDASGTRHSAAVRLVVGPPG
jgi:S1-C subfamily serine protease